MTIKTRLQKLEAAQRAATEWAARIYAGMMQLQEAAQAGNRDAQDRLDRLSVIFERARQRRDQAQSGNHDDQDAAAKIRASQAGRIAGRV